MDGQREVYVQPHAGGTICFRDRHSSSRAVQCLTCVRTMLDACISPDQLRLKHRVLGGIHDQLWNLMRGFYDVIPAHLISVFDYQVLYMTQTAPEVSS